MNTYRITCREYSYFVKEVKANSEDEANEKLTCQSKWLSRC